MLFRSVVIRDVRTTVAESRRYCRSTEGSNVSRRVVIVGGNAGGMSTATRLRRLDEAVEIVVFERGEHVSYASCGLPYHLSDEVAEDDLAVLTPERIEAMFDVNVRTGHDVTDVDTDEQSVTVETPGGTSVVEYDDLVLAPGAAPVVPPIEGLTDVETHTLRTVEDATTIRERVDDAGGEHALVVGAGYVGLEVAETLDTAGFEVSVAEMRDRVMPRTLGPAMAALVHNHLREQGVDLRLNTTVEAFRDGDRTTAVLDDGELETDLVVLATGVRPRTDLAEAAGLDCHESGAIRVDERLETSAPDVYALGDAVATPAVGGGHAWVPLGGPANRQGRVLGSVLAGQEATLSPVFDTAVAKVFDLTIGTVGETEPEPVGSDDALEKVYVYPPSHAEYYPGGDRLWVKLLFDPDDGTVRGAQVVGRDGVDKRTDVLATAIQHGDTVGDLAALDLGYAPPYGSAKDPVNVAGMAAENVVDGVVEQVHWHDLDDHLDEGRCLVDCRPPEMRAADGYLEAARNVPLPELRDSVDELPDEVTVHCKMGQTSYMAARVLDQSGVDVQNLAGGYELYDAVQRDRAARPDTPVDAPPVADDD
jgi:NADPH-dependent 2,4-dienoyl-CoA reductase/sulfur reductase-like enzyme/rhodanese-related sulfurtransferase